MITSSNHFQNENTFALESEQSLIESFRTRDQKKLVLPAGLRFPLKVQSYLTWKESSGVYTYLVFKKPNWDMPRSVAFKRVAATEGVTGGMCSWCHSYGTSDEIGMLSVAMNSNTSCGYILCSDLRCIEKIEEAAAWSGKNPENWIDQLYFRLGAFFEQISQYKPE